MNLTDFMDTLILIWIETALGLKEKSNNNQIKALEGIKSAAKGQVETLLPLKSEEVCPQRPSSCFGWSQEIGSSNSCFCQE